MMDDTYRTIEGVAEGLYKEKGSKFISLAYPVVSQEQVKEHLTNLRKQLHDARHQCYSYIIGHDGDQWRLNDDGEPSGTAGRPIHGQILSHNLTNVLVVVVRYFGGTKLGVSGLTNAYKEAANDALSNASIVTRTRTQTYRVSFSYADTNNVMRIINDEQITISNQQFDSESHLILQFRLSREQSIIDRIERISSVTLQRISKPTT